MWTVITIVAITIVALFVVVMAALSIFHSLVNVPYATRLTNMLRDALTSAVGPLSTAFDAMVKENLRLLQQAGKDRDALLEMQQTLAFEIERYQVANEQNQLLESRIDEAETALREAEDRRKRLREENEQLLQRVDAADKEQQRAYAELGDQMAELRLELESTISSKTAIASDCIAARNEIAILVADKEGLKDKYEQVEAELAVRTSELAAARTALASSDNACNELKTRLSNMDAALTVRTSELVTAKENFERLQTENVHWLNQIATLKKRYALFDSSVKTIRVSRRYGEGQHTGIGLYSPGDISPVTVCPAFITSDEDQVKLRDKLSNIPCHTEVDITGLVAKFANTTEIIIPTSISDITPEPVIAADDVKEGGNG